MGSVIDYFQLNASCLLCECPRSNRVGREHVVSLVDLLRQLLCIRGFVRSFSAADVVHTI